MKRNEDSSRDNIKHVNIPTIRVPEEEREKGAENIFEDIIAENFPVWQRKQSSKSRKHRESQTESTQRGPHQITLKLKWQRWKIKS